MDMPVCIVIPTFNRAHCIAQAVTAALDQSHPDAVVLVVDDGSTDATAAVLARFLDHPRLCYLRLAANLGTAGAKNAGILLAGDRAVTFHDSDDIPHRDKVLRQSRVLNAKDIAADPHLNWALAHQVAGSTLRMGAVLTHHDLVLPDGRRVEIRRAISLIDDVFPNLQLGPTVPGDWMHVNSGLFHPEVFRRLGGFSDCIEEDREFRNRLILGGEIVRVIDEILLTKIETPDSLTQSPATDYQSARRAADRLRVWQKVDHWLLTREVTPEPIDLPGLEFTAISRPDLLAPSGALATPATRHRLAAMFGAEMRRAG
ncbi:glycosyltransferase [Paracoccaceae bacterium Fryx2]|nr:glycosyltransferase [Paracoccaceae bacterium Fryx2]